MQSAAFCLPVGLALLGTGCAAKSTDSSAGGTVGSTGATDDTDDTDPGDGSGHIPVYVGDLEFRTDAEVQLIEGYETIQGSVALLDGVTDLSPLYALTRITGSLRIEDTSTLPSLTGLEQLTTIGGDLAIRGSTFAALSELESLTAVEGVHIEETTQLQDLRALSRVTALSRNLVVQDSTLASLAGLEGLTTIAGYLNIQQASALTSLDGLGGLTTVGKTVFLVQNPLLVEVDGLSGLTTVGESLAITDLPVLSTLQLPLVSVRESVQVVRNPELTTIALPSLGEAGELEIHRNPLLTELTVPALEAIGGWMQIDDNAALTGLGNFSVLHTVGGRVSITRNGSLTQLAASLPALSEVGENLDVHDNPVLPACEVEALAAALTELGGSVVNTGNDETAACD